MSLLQKLFEEFTEWYKGLALENGVLPRSISGVDGGGRQFIYLLESLELHHMARNKYIRLVLDEYKSIAYAYGGLVLRGDSDSEEIEEVLDVVAADAKHYITGHWRVIRDEDGVISALQHLGTSKGDDSVNQPAAWFLAGVIRFSESEKIKFGNMLSAAGPSVTFSRRNPDA
jgi:hypothetical protein